MRAAICPNGQCSLAGVNLDWYDLPLPPCFRVRDAAKELRGKVCNMLHERKFPEWNGDEYENDLSEIEGQGGTARRRVSKFTRDYSATLVTQSTVNYMVYHSNGPPFERFMGISAFLYVALVF